MAMNCKPPCGKFVLLALFGVATLGWVVMLLWNWLAPILFAGGREISYLQAIGLLVLSKILFGGFRCHGGWHGRWRQDRLDRMTPEEREQFKAGMHCCFGKREQGAGMPADQAD